MQKNDNRMNIPRRIDILRNTHAELAIRNAINEVEKVGADIKLTQSVILLSEALNKLSDYIDEQINQNSNH